MYAVLHMPKAAAPWQIKAARLIWNSGCSRSARDWLAQTDPTDAKAVSVVRIHYALMNGIVNSFLV